MAKYEYIAFISYKREDEKWAKWLQKKLEYYKLPSSVRKDNPDLPDKVRPVARDTTDFEPGNLAKKIQATLDSSKFLIVICSPRSANSVWVSKEVKSFIDRGKADYIIPFIIGGTPNAIDPKDECFPEGLRQLSGEQELLGANINEMGRDAAAIKVIARMFNLRFDSLWQRYEKEKRRRYIFTAVFLLLMVGIAVIITGVIAKKNFLLEDANQKLKVANTSIKTQKDSIQQAKNSLAKAYADIMRSQKELINTQDSLRSTNIELNKTNDNLCIANLNLQKERRAVLEKNREITQGLISLLITSAKEQYSREEYLLAEKTISQAGDYIKNNDIDSSELLTNYERTIRLIDRKWDEPGIKKLNSTQVPQSLYGYFNDNRIIILDQKKHITSWNFNSLSKVSSLDALLNINYMIPMNEDLGSVKDNKLLVHENGELRVINIYNNEVIGHPLLVGKSFGTIYKFGKKDDTIIFSKDSTLFLYSYISSQLDTIKKLNSRISGFSLSPLNDNLISTVSWDSCVNTINIKSRTIIRNKKFDSSISSISYHPSGEYLAITGDNVMLTNSEFELLATSHTNQEGNIYYSKFNPAGDKLYTFSHPGIHAVWSLGYMPYDYSFLSKSGNYGVRYKNKAYRIYNYKTNSFITNIFTKGDDEKIICLGNMELSMLGSKWNNKEKNYYFFYQRLDESPQIILDGLQVESPRLSMVNDYNGTLYITAEDTIYNYNLSTQNLNKISGITAKDIKYNTVVDSLLVLSDKGVLYKVANDLSSMEEWSSNCSDIRAFDIDSYGNIYLSDLNGYLYYLAHGSDKKHYIGISDNVESLSVDSEGKYLLVHFYFHPKIEFNIEEMPYGYNIVSDTKIWDIERKEIIDDLSSYKLTGARLFRAATGELFIDTGHFLLPFSPLDTVENRIKKNLK